MKTLIFYVSAMFVSWLAVLGFMINIILNQANISVPFIGLIFTSIFFSAQALTKLNNVLQAH